MAQDNSNQNFSEPVDQTVPAASPEDAAATGWDAPEEDGRDARRISDLEAEIASLKDQHLRALAEVENVRRRGQRDREEAAKFGAASFARDLLAVADNLRRGVESIPADVRAEDQNLTNLLAGVELVERDLLAAFEKHGVQRVDPKPGEKFDPNLHQAMFELENTGHPAGTVAQVLQTGYVLNGRLLRAAMVGVAKGEPAEAQRVDTTV